MSPYDYLNLCGDIVKGPGENYSGDKYLSYDCLEAENKAIEKVEHAKRDYSSNLRLAQKRILIGFTSVLSLTLLLGFFAFATNMKATAGITALYEGLMSARYYALQLNIDLLSAYGAMRDIAVAESGDTSYITSHISIVEDNVKMLREDLGSLRSLIVGDESLTSDFDELNDLLLEWDKLRSRSIIYALEGDMASCRDNVRIANQELVPRISELCKSIAFRATSMAADRHADYLSQSKSFVLYSAILTIVIFIISLVVILYVKYQSDKALNLVETLNHDQNEALDELMIMDETLRQNLSRLEHEGEVIREMKEKYANSLEASNDAIWELNIETGEFFASEKWCEITGLVNMPKFDISFILKNIHPEDRKKFHQLFDRRTDSFNTQIRSCNKDSSFRWLDIRGKWLDEYRMTGSVSDITQKKRSEQYIEYMAYHDAVTRLPNRAFFIRSLEEALKKSKEENTSGCVLFIDLDNFKLINDRHGHDFGDKLLHDVARGLRLAMREKTVVARFGGDEFLVLVEDVRNKGEIAQIIKAITEALDSPILLGGSSFYMTASIGVSIFPEDGDDVNQLLKNADSAMFESKSAGRNTFAFYEKTMSDKVIRKSAISDALRSSIETDSIFLVFQPQFRLSTGRADSCEVLLRLRHGDLGAVSPAEFIPVAEETRLIVPIGYWIIRKTIEIDLELQKKGVKLESLSINVSDIQLREYDFIEKVKAIIDEYNYDPGRLHFEITESILLDNIEDKIVVFKRLRDIGVKIELDDFGTGYCSLNYVRVIPLDVIKIDKCFVDEIGISGEKEDLIDLIIRLARMFGADVVAEGVETNRQVEFLRKKGDIILQGYYYSRPVGVGELPETLNELNGTTDI